MVRGSRELFLEACGLSGPLQLHLGDRGGVESRTFEQPFVVVGRSPGADLVLDDAVVSRRHAYLQVIAGRVFCVDMRSRSGVVWERGPDRSGWVDGQQGIGIGPFRIRAGGDASPVNLFDPLQREVRIAAGSPEYPPLPKVTLEFTQEPEQPSWRVSRMLTLVGRAPECPLRLEDRGVSKFHCSLLRMPAGVWLVDLLGRGGIDVNGQPVRWARLEHGDRVGVGPYLFRIRCEGPPADPHGPGTRALGVQSVVTPTSGWPATSPEVGDGSTRGELMLSPAWSPPSAAAGLPGDPASMKAELVEPFSPYTMAAQFGQMQQQMCDQFGQMQQQMCDQFQQIMMMAQSFISLNRDQMALVREEFDRIRQLNQDLHALQAELATRSVAVPPSASHSPVDNSTVDSLARIETLLLASQPRPGITTPEGGPAGLVTARRESKRASYPPLAGVGKHGTTGNGAVATEGPSPAEKRAGSPPPRTRDRAAARLANASDEDIHGELHLRIAAIQVERQGRLQRVLDLMLGR